MACGWIVSGILTATGSLPDDPAEKGYKARADAYVGALNTASWFFVPYPCKVNRKHEFRIKKT